MGRVDAGTERGVSAPSSGGTYLAKLDETREGGVAPDGPHGLAPKQAALTRRVEHKDDN